MPTYQHNEIYSVTSLVAVAEHAGSYFFTPDTMRAFKSRILSGIAALDGNKTIPGNRFLFVTSEKYGEDTPRHYAVRIATLGTQRDDRAAIDISTLDGSYSSAAAARKAMADYAARDKAIKAHPAGKGVTV